MRRRRRIALVIDTDVAQSCGGPGATAPTARNCRDFLRTMLEVCYSVLLPSDFLPEEWERHRSQFFVTWIRAMFAHKKQRRADACPARSLRAKIERTAKTRKEREAMMKDVHLIEAALAADCVIVSRDTTARELFRRAARTVGEIRNIVWVNPDAPEDNPIRWLKRGAPALPMLLLGQKPE